MIKKILLVSFLLAYASTATARIVDFSATPSDADCELLKQAQTALLVECVSCDKVTPAYIVVGNEDKYKDWNFYLIKQAQGKGGKFNSVCGFDIDPPTLIAKGQSHSANRYTSGAEIESWIN